MWSGGEDWSSADNWSSTTAADWSNEWPKQWYEYATAGGPSPDYSTSSFPDSERLSSGPASGIHATATTGESRKRRRQDAAPVNPAAPTTQNYSELGPQNPSTVTEGPHSATTTWEGYSEPWWSGTGSAAGGGTDSSWLPISSWPAEGSTVGSTVVLGGSTVNSPGSSTYYYEPQASAASASLAGGSSSSDDSAASTADADHPAGSIHASSQYRSGESLDPSSWVPVVSQKNPVSTYQNKGSAPRTYDKGAASHCSTRVAPLGNHVVNHSQATQSSGSTTAQQGSTTTEFVGPTTSASVVTGESVFANAPSVSAATVDQWALPSSSASRNSSTGPEYTGTEPSSSAHDSSWKYYWDESSGVYYCYESSNESRATVHPAAGPNGNPTPTVPHTTVPHTTVPHTNESTEMSRTQAHVQDSESVSSKGTTTQSSRQLAVGLTPSEVVRACDTDHYTDRSSASSEYYDPATNTLYVTGDSEHPHAASSATAWDPPLRPDSGHQCYGPFTTMTRRCDDTGTEFPGTELYRTTTGGPGPRVGVPHHATVGTPAFSGSASYHAVRPSEPGNPAQTGDPWPPQGGPNGTDSSATTTDGTSSRSSCAVRTTVVQHIVGSSAVPMSTHALTRQGATQSGHDEASWGQQVANSAAHSSMATRGKGCTANNLYVPRDHGPWDGVSQKTTVSVGPDSALTQQSHPVPVRAHGPDESGTTSCLIRKGVPESERWEPGLNQWKGQQGTTWTAPAVVDTCSRITKGPGPLPVAPEWQTSSADSYPGGMVSLSKQSGPTQNLKGPVTSIPIQTRHTVTGFKGPSASFPGPDFKGPIGTIGSKNGDSRIQGPAIPIGGKAGGLSGTTDFPVSQQGLCNPARPAIPRPAKPGPSPAKGPVLNPHGQVVVVKGPTKGQPTPMATIPPTHTTIPVSNPKGPDSSRKGGKGVLIGKVPPDRLEKGATGPVGKVVYQEYAERTQATKQSSKGYLLPMRESHEY